MCSSWINAASVWPNLIWRPFARTRRSNPSSSDALVNPRHLLDAQLAAIRACAALVRSKDIDLNSYTVAARANDLDDLRRSLGTNKRLRLLAWSAGTEVALEYMRRFGDSIESAVLAGTVGPDNILSLPSTSDLHLHKLATLVAGDPAFKSRRSLFETVQDMRQKLEQAPISIATTKTNSGQAQVQAGLSHSRQRCNRK
jgi:pimeloyl-ACP methyl ester carboxylesterase